MGHVDEDGYLVITDRKKDLIITSQGKNVAPQEIENRLKYHPLISQAVVIGDRRPYLVALITLDAEAASKLVSERALDTSHTTFAELPEIQEAVAAAVGAVNAEFSRAEQVKRWRILPRDFLQEEEEITPTLKVRRRTIADKYAGVIAELYA